jgi:hypothetical protein
MITGSPQSILKQLATRLQAAAAGQVTVQLSLCGTEDHGAVKFVGQTCNVGQRCQLLNLASI